MNEDDQYFYAVGKDRKGPVDLPELKRLALSGDLTRKDKVWSKGMESWTKAGDVEEIFDGVPPELDDPEPCIAPAVGIERRAETVTGVANTQKVADAAEKQEGIDANPKLAAFFGLAVWILICLFRGCSQ